jgi:hypothetical protein
MIIKRIRSSRDLGTDDRETVSVEVAKDIVANICPIGIIDATRHELELFLSHYAAKRDRAPSIQTIARMA